MTVLKVTDGTPIDGRGFNLSALLFASSYYRSSKVFSANYDDATVVFSGTGFTYDDEGYPSGGTVTSYGVYTEGGFLAGFYERINLPAVQFVDVAITPGTTDDRSLYKKMFRGNDQITGADQDDYIQGFDGNDKLKGGIGWDTIKGNAGDDTLVGGAWSDTLTGGTGKDRFVFNGPLLSEDADRITDFSSVDDTLALENSRMKALGDTWVKAMFYKSAAGIAHDASDRLVYETDSGALRYDPDGNGPEDSILLATLKGAPDISWRDFVII